MSAPDHLESPQSAPAAEALTLDAHDLAALLKCSVRSVYRMRDRRELPAHLKLGRLVRWPRKVIDEWLAGRATAAR
ncbi:helix-turn-helix domain-containing protein [Gemmata sp. JC717]|uniref:helix-turn-helix transcriptional regulator n=1 Tax=Gemmata algarum TaxID=2975278 RepID=UPI0021BAAFCA|nr:helix-turn-helix domain-containing protein [Gemmata algarum]MDY3555750.1 helix-turn-helix domain-containing protein [Gemmata algarum]